MTAPFPSAPSSTPPIDKLPSPCKNRKVIRSAAALPPLLLPILMRHSPVVLVDGMRHSDLMGERT
jgi:hypothetical protein